MNEMEGAVLCIPRDCIVERDRFTPWAMAGEFLRAAEDNMIWLPRSEAEASDDLVQPIPCALVCDADGRFRVFRRVRDGRADLRRRISLIVGGHIDWGPEDRDFSSWVMDTLLREISEELGADAETATPIGIVVDFSSIHASRHVGIVHEAAVAGEIRPRATEEFSTRSLHNGQSYTSSALSAFQKEFDPWSAIIFGDYINEKYSLDVGQQLALQATG